MTEFTDPIPRSFKHWRYCIERWCGLELTTEFIDSRIAALENPKDEHTRRFVDCYGQSHRQAVIGWLKRARSEVGAP